MASIIHYFFFVAAITLHPDRRSGVYYGLEYCKWIDDLMRREKKNGISDL